MSLGSVASTLRDDSEHVKARKVNMPEAVLAGAAQADASRVNGLEVYAAGAYSESRVTIMIHIAWSVGRDD
jgi:hypothetical protein